MDTDGYPEEHELQTIREWQDDYLALMTYIYERWKYADWGWREPDADHECYHISTAGWSGNESLIEAMEANRMFWLMTWQSSRRGGHYEFKVRTPCEKAT